MPSLHTPTNQQGELSVRLLSTLVHHSIIWQPNVAHNASPEFCVPRQRYTHRSGCPFPTRVQVRSPDGAQGAVVDVEMTLLTDNPGVQPLSCFSGRCAGLPFTPSPLKQLRENPDPNPNPGRVAKSRSPSES